jgi:hypothetical protein
MPILAGWKNFFKKMFRILPIQFFKGCTIKQNRQQDVKSLPMDLNLRFKCKKIKHKTMLTKFNERVVGSIVNGLYTKASINNIVGSKQILTKESVYQTICDLFFEEFYRDFNKEYNGYIRNLELRYDKTLRLGHWVKYPEEFELLARLAIERLQEKYSIKIEIDISLKDKTERFDKSLEIAQSHVVNYIKRSKELVHGFFGVEIEKKHLEKAIVIVETHKNVLTDILDKEILFGVPTDGSFAYFLNHDKAVELGKHSVYDLMLYVFEFSIFLTALSLQINGDKGSKGVDRNQIAKRLTSGIKVIESYGYDAIALKQALEFSSINIGHIDFILFRVLFDAFNLDINNLPGIYRLKLGSQVRTLKKALQSITIPIEMFTTTKLKLTHNL